MNKYKLILNFTLDDEKIIYFDRITRKKLKLMDKSKAFILFSRDNYYRIFLPIDSKVSEEMKKIYNEEPKFYCNDYKGQKYE